MYVFPNTSANLCHIHPLATIPLSAMERAAPWAGILRTFVAWQPSQRYGARPARRRNARPGLDQIRCQNRAQTPAPRLSSSNHVTNLPMLFTFSRSLVLRISCRKSQIQRRSRTYPCRIANHRRARFVDALSRACVSDVSQLSRRRSPRGGLRRPDFHPRAQRKCACTSCARVRGMSPGPALPLYPSIDSARDRWGTAPSCSDTPAPTGTCPWNRLRTICGRRPSRAVPPLLCGSRGGRASCDEWRFSRRRRRVARPRIYRGDPVGGGRRNWTRAGVLRAQGPEEEKAPLRNVLISRRRCALVYLLSNVAVTRMGCASSRHLCHFPSR